VVLTRQLLEQWYGDELQNAGFLDLDNKNIISIEDGTFNGLTKIHSLNLRENQLTSINRATFDGLTDLANLYLQNNQIESIDEKAFMGWEI
jgi:Leucine-rich repeat (LRR) protein